MMDSGTVTDFSIERILGLKPQMKHRAPDSLLPGIPLLPAGCGSYSGRFSLPVPGPECLQQRGVNNHGEFYPCGAAGFSFYPLNPLNQRVYLHFSLSDTNTDAQHLPGYHGYHQPAAVSAQPQPQQQLRQRPRMRTVFTEGQSKQLEALFESTHYPTVEARAQLAQSAGLSEETVRVWFKNRRARRKRQRSGSKVKSPPPPPPPPPGAERRIFSSFL